MATVIRKIDYYATTVPDKAGEGHRILSELAREGVNLLAFSGFPVGDGKAQVDLVPEHAVDFGAAAERIKLKTRKPKRALFVQGDDDRVGAVAEIVGKLAAAKIPIVAAQALSAGLGRWAMIVWVSPARWEKACHALGV